MGMVIGGVLSWARTIGSSSVAVKMAAAMVRVRDEDGVFFNTEITESTEDTEKKVLRLMVVLL
jgi:hypothetical protein